MFKFYSQNQMQLLPPALDDQMEEDHLARLISTAVDEMNTSIIEKQYSEKGQNAYAPKMILKVLIYGYATGLRSSRKLARNCKENVVFMWLSGRQTPDFRTISDFRQGKLTDFRDLFRQVLTMCGELGMIRCGKVSLDGTIFRADTNTHRAVYRKSLRRREEKLNLQIDEILDEAGKVDREEDALYGMEKDILNTGTKIDREVIRKLARELETRKRRNIKDKKEKEEKRASVREQIKRMGAKRNSYAKSDPDSTVMMMKEGYTAPAYNVQFATEHQVVLAYRGFQYCSDNQTLRAMNEEIKTNMGKNPELMIADAGYGTKANTKYLKQNRQQFLMPYRTYRQDRVRRKMGTYSHTHPDVYWEKMKWEMWKRLESKEGKELMDRRGYDVEAVIGDIKHNRNFRRFLLRGRKKIETEIGLVSMAHNLKKIKSALQYWTLYLKRVMTVGLLVNQSV